MSRRNVHAGAFILAWGASIACSAGVDDFRLASGTHGDGAAGGSDGGDVGQGGMPAAGGKDVGTGGSSAGRGGGRSTGGVSAGGLPGGSGGARGGSGGPGGGTAGAGGGMGGAIVAWPGTPARVTTSEAL